MGRLLWYASGWVLIRIIDCDVYNECVLVYRIVCWELLEGDPLSFS